MKEEKKPIMPNETTAQPPRFDAAISEEKFQETLSNCETWDSIRLLLSRPLTRDSETLLSDYQDETEGVSEEWVNTMNILSDYRDHLVQCLHMCSAALERVVILGEYLARDIDTDEYPQSIARTFQKTVH